MNKQIQQISVKALFEKDGEVLIVKDIGKKVLPTGEENQNWELPGGRIQFGETPEETLRREISEEIGVADFEIGNVVDVWTFVSTVQETDYQFVVIVYHCSLKYDKIILSNEHEEYDWIDQGEIDKHSLRAGYKKTLGKVFNA